MPAYVPSKRARGPGELTRIRRGVGGCRGWGASLCTWEIDSRPAYIAFCPQLTSFGPAELVAGEIGRIAGKNRHSGQCVEQARWELRGRARSGRVVKSMDMPYLAVSETLVSLRSYFLLLTGS